MSIPLRERLARIPGITVTNIGVTDLGGGKSLQFSVQGPDLAELERCRNKIDARLQRDPGPGRPGQHAQARQADPGVEVRRDAAADLGLNVNCAGRPRCAPLVAGADGGQLARPRRRELRHQGAPGPRERDARRAPRPAAAAGGAGGRRQRRASCGCRRWPTSCPPPARTRSTAAHSNREINYDANALGRSSGEISADIRAALDAIAFPPGYRYSFGGSTKDMQESFGTRWAGAAAGGDLHLHDPGLAVPQLPAAGGDHGSLPLSLIGVMLALLDVAQHAEHVLVIGFIMLMGLVTKNAILLVDFANRSREGLPRPDGTRAPGVERARRCSRGRVRLRRS
jgi:hydrophobic/amphiphilic exporter-1 (mainly G- bacteria), HAE1 family